MPPVPADLQLDQETLEVLAVAAAAVAALSLLLVVFALARLRALNKRLRRLAAARGASTADGATRTDPTALRHVGVVRYDAFGDMGGRLSFSAAMYDDEGDGLVITSINGRSETRSYAKALTGRRSDQRLSPEEEDAIDRAGRD